MQINAGRVDISLKKDDSHKQWENIGTFLAGHGISTPRSKRGMYICMYVRGREREREREISISYYRVIIPLFQKRGNFTYIVILIDQIWLPHCG